MVTCFNLTENVLIPLNILRVPQNIISLCFHMLLNSIIATMKFFKLPALPSDAISTRRTSVLHEWYANTKAGESILTEG